MSEKLPAVAEARMAEIRSGGTWGSALSADEFAAIRSVGFEPVGQVFGAAAVARFSRAGQPHGGPALAIMSLGPQRHQAARIQI